MGYVVKMPKLGMDMDQGTIVQWLVGEGDEVESGQVLAEIESEKTTGEVEAREDGIVHQIVLDVGESVEPGGAIAVVGAPDEDVSELLAEAGGETSGGDTGTPSSADDSAATAGGGGDAQSTAAAASVGTASAASKTRVKATPRAKKRAEELGVELAGLEGTGPQGAVSAADVEAAVDSSSGESEAESDSVKATPRAKKRAEELGVELAGLEGTGPQGAVSADDVEAAAESASEAAQPAGESGATVAENRVFAAPSARRLAREQGVDIASVAGSGPGGRVSEADVRAAAGGDAEGLASTEPPGTRDEERPLSGMRRTIANRLGQSYRESVHVTEHRTADAEALLDAAAAADEGLAPDVSVNDILLLVLSATLDENPAFNATFEDDVHHLHEAQNICVAIDIDEGLVAPVIRDVGALSLAELAAERKRMTGRALSGEYTMDDLTGGTFTVSNLGVLGVESFDPVINPPQVAILGVNTIEDAVVPVDDGIGVRKQISFDLSFDHRIVDGADAARFLGSLVEHVENPWPLVVGAGGR